jgi:LPXTG-motif cell wall-anchored protein
MSLETGLIVLVVLGLAAFIFWKKKNKATGGSGGGLPKDDNVNQQQK